MNIVDILILLLLFSYILKGFKSGAIKEIISFVGGFLVLIIAYVLKNPVSEYMYENFPFFNFGGMFSGVSVLNIIVYELIAFVGVATILMLIYKVVIFGTNIIETILKMTVILEIPSKIIGLIVGFIEGVVVVFLILFISMQFNYTREYIDESKFGNLILKSTPVLSDATKDVYNSLNEIYAVAEEYKDASDKTNVNLQAFDILLKYKILDVDSANLLITSEKVKIPGADSVLKKYNE